MDTYEFETQKRTFDVHGYAYDPSVAGNGALIGSSETAAANGFNMIDTLRPSKAQRRAAKRKRGPKGDASVVDGVDTYLGPWAGYEEPKDEMAVADEEEEDDEEWRAEKKRREDAKASAQEKMKQSAEEKSTFHGKELYDYAGRSYLHIPTDVDVKLNPTEGMPPPNAYVPDGKCLHTWTGHTKGVSAIRLFPRSGHLLLSSSMDTKIKLWDVYHEGNCLRTFMGHSQAVKDVAFDRKGERFLSASYDRSVKLWDTETGKVISRFSTGKVANVVKFHPDGDRQNIFLAGMQDKKILQWDTRSHEIVQTYDQHLGPVNTITFVDNNRRFMTTSDDKTIRGWDFDIPVVIKYIAEPYMHSMPSVAKHPGSESSSSLEPAPGTGLEVTHAYAWGDSNTPLLRYAIEDIANNQISGWRLSRSTTRFLCTRRTVPSGRTRRSASPGTRLLATRARLTSRPTASTSRLARVVAMSCSGTGRPAALRSGCARTSRW